MVLGQGVGPGEFDKGESSQVAESREAAFCLEESASRCQLSMTSMAPSVSHPWNREPPAALQILAESTWPD